MTALPELNSTDPEQIRFAINVIAKVAVGPSWPGVRVFEKTLEWLEERELFFRQTALRNSVANVVVGALFTSEWGKSDEVRTAVRSALSNYELKQV